MGGETSTEPEPKAFDLLARSIVGQVFSLEGTKEKYLITGINTVFNYPREIGDRSFEYPIQTYNLSCTFRFSDELFPPHVLVQNCSLEVLKRMTLVPSLELLTLDEAHALALYEERQKESPLAQTAQTPKKPKMTPQVVGEKREHP